MVRFGNLISLYFSMLLLSLLNSFAPSVRLGSMTLTTETF